MKGSYFARPQTAPMYPHQIYQAACPYLPVMYRSSTMVAALRFYFLLTMMSSWVATRASFYGSLRPDYYRWTCPQAESIVFAGVQRAIAQEARMAASLLRLHFHDCFVNGCDGSLLLDDTESFKGEKTATNNVNSLRGFKVIDSIKEELESACPGQVSCADILALAARDSVVSTGGPYWSVQLGRRDSLTASKAAAENGLPFATSNISTLISNFQNVGLTENDLVTLSGAHTIGKARCKAFSSRFMGVCSDPYPTTETKFLRSLKQLCCQGFVINNNTVTALDLRTPVAFDNQYYENLRSGEGLLDSDQLLYSNGGTTRKWVESFIQNREAFFENFKKSMVKMGNIRPLTGTCGEIRRNCRFVNQ